MRYFTSDTHFGHLNIIKYSGRPWSQYDTDEAKIAAMNAGLVERWNSVVNPDDEVFHLGDVVMNVKYLDLVSQLNGHKRLIAGNHDKCWAHHRKGVATAIETYKAAGFEEIQSDGVITDFRLANGRLVTLSHLPYYGDHESDERYAEFRPKDHGQINVCGHVHEAWLIEPNHHRSINVGVDVWDWTPISEDILIETIEDLFS